MILDTDFIRPDIGLTPLHVGIVIEDRLIAPPSQFALAFIGIQDPITLDALIKDIIDGVMEGEIDVSDTPLLAHYVDTPGFGMDTLREMAIDHYGTAKMIERSAMNFLEPEYDGQTGLYKAELTQKSQAYLVIETRQLRSRKEGPYGIHIFDPFDLSALDFRGGSELTKWHLKKGHHWSKGLEQDNAYIASLNKTAEKQFRRKIEIIDYYRACALLGLDDLIRKGDTHFITGGYGGDFESVAVPFNFNPGPFSHKNEKYKATKYALEMWLMRYAPAKVKKQVLGHKTGKITMREIDEYGIGKPIASRMMGKAMKEHWMTRGAILYNRSFPKFTWAVIQAFEEHCFGLGRKFHGYSKEFVGTPYMTNSIVFDLPPFSGRDGKNVSVRVVFDRNFSLPHFMYVTYGSRQLRRAKELRGNPRNYINLPPEVQRRDDYFWKDVDWRTGEMAVFSLKQPNEETLRQGAEDSKRTGGPTIGYEKLFKRYQAFYQSLRAK